MKVEKSIIFVALALAIACAIARLVFSGRQAPKELVSPAPKAAQKLTPAQPKVDIPPAAPLAEAPVAVAKVPAPAASNPAAETATPAKPLKADTKGPKAAAQAGPRGSSAKAPLQDPLARVALALVGADPTAEAYWFAAINDPTLPAEERQDLIEDLNEDGLSDPKHPAPEDLPLLLSRIQLIEAAGPNAMDQVNTDAFQEAYKDLVNLANVALGRGEPVR